MPLTDSTFDVADAIYNKLLGDKANLGLADVWWGDQGKMPSTPCAAVEPGTKARDLAGAPRQTLVTIETYILLYVSKIQDNPEQNKKDSITFAESVESYLHQDTDLGGLVIHCMVTSLDPGFVTRGGAVMSAVRMTVTSTSKVLLPS